MDLDNFRKYNPKHILRISIVTITLKDVIREMTRVLLSPSQSNIIENYSATNCIIHRWRELTSPHIGSHSHGWIPTSAVYHYIVCDVIMERYLIPAFRILCWIWNLLCVFKNIWNKKFKWYHQLRILHSFTNIHQLH